MPTDRIVLHLDMDAFFAACEEQRRPELVGLPVIVGADPKGGHGRGVVTTANYAARPFGVRSGMPIQQAWRKAPEAVYLSPDHTHYRAVSRRIFDALRLGHVVEQVSVDEGFIDATGKTTWADAEAYARRVQDEVARASGGLGASFGVAPNKLVAKIASDFRKPRGITVVPPASVQEFLEPLPARHIPGIGPKTADRLDAMGVTTIAELRKVPREDLESAFGSHGRWMERAALGDDDSSVRAEWEPSKSMSEERTFEEDERDRGRILAVMRRMMDDLERDLRSKGYWYKTIGLKLRYEDFTTLNRQASLPTHTQDTTTARRLVPRLLDELLDDPRAVRLVGLRFGELAHGLGQADLPAYVDRLGAAEWRPDLRPRGQQRLEGPDDTPT